LAGRPHDRPLALPGADPSRGRGSPAADGGRRAALPRRRRPGHGARAVVSALPAPADLARRPALVRRQELLRRALWVVLVLAIAFVFVWVLFVAPTTGKLATSFGSAVHDPKDFFVTVLNSGTLAGLYFFVDIGFTFIFGLIRFFDMVHCVLFLLVVYIELQ